MKLNLIMNVQLNIRISAIRMIKRYYKLAEQCAGLQYVLNFMIMMASI